MHLFLFFIYFGSNLMQYY